MDASEYDSKHRPSCGERPPADDFARLGVRRREARVPVIRRAASVATASVSARAMQAGDLADEAVSKIAASTYRLLDPRRRTQFMERVQLLQFEASPVDVDPWWNSERPLKVKSADRRDGFDTSAAAEVYEPVAPADESTLPSVAKRCLAPIKHRGVGIGAALSLIALIGYLGAGLIQDGDGQVALRSDVQVVPVDLNGRQGVPPKAGHVTTLDEEPSAASELVSSVDRENWPANEFQEGFTASTENPLEQFDMQRDGASPDGGGPLFESLLETQIDPDSLENQAVNVLLPDPQRIDSKLMDPFRASATDVPSQSPDHTAEPAEAGDNVAEEVPIAFVVAEERDAGEQRFEIPPADQLDVSQARLARLVDSLPPAESDAAALRNVRDLLGAASTSDVGSADRWVVWLASAEQLLLIGRPVDAERIVDDMTAEFQVGELDVRQRLLRSIEESAEATTQKERVVSWAMVTSELALQSEAFAVAAEVARVATGLAVQLGDAGLRAAIKQRTEAIKLAKRMQPTVSKVMERPIESASRSDANTVGRYLCFYMRDWDRGLPWLAKCSSAKLAKLSSDELTGTDAVTLAASWIDASDDLRGRSRDSMVLHASALVETALQQASGLRAEDLKRMLEQINGLLPDSIRPTAIESEVQPGPPAPRAAPKLMTGLVGRLRANGLDVGAIIQYKPGLALTQESLMQIMDRLNVRAQAIGLDFYGLLDLQAATTVRVVVGGVVSDDDAVTVSVADHQIKLVREAGRKLFVGTTDLNAGTHLVHWQVAGKKLENCHLSIQDDRDKNSLEVRHSQQLLNQLKAAGKTVLQVNMAGLD